MHIIVLNSCKQKVTHSDAVEYLNSVNSLVGKAAKESSQYIVYKVKFFEGIANSSIQSTSNDLPAHFDTAKLEVFKDKHQRYNSYLDSLLNVLYKIDEIDKSINLKAKAIQYIKHQLELHNEDFQSNLVNYFGLPSKRTLSISLGLAGDNLDRSFSEINESNIKYAIKYRISEKELLDSGF